MTDFDEKLRIFETRFGGAWIKIKFYDDGTAPDEGDTPGKLRFCEAIKLARRCSIVLSPENVVCPGANRSLGWTADSDDQVAEALARNQSIGAAAAREILLSVPKLDGELRAVAFGTKDKPDIVASYAQPSALMKIVRAFEVAYNVPLEQSFSSILTVCGSVAVKSFLTRKICASFGCEFSRRVGGIGRDRLAVGVPCDLIDRLLDTLP